MIENMKTCSRCKQEKPENKFAWRYENGTKRRRGTCAYCQSTIIKQSLARPAYRRQYNRRRRERRLEKAKFLFDYLVLNPCVICGINDPFVLQFDHVRGDKLFNLSSEIREQSFDAIKAEMAKCDILCGNCHMRKTKSNGSIKTSKKQWLLIRRQKIRDYLTTHPCVDCQEFDPAVLEFDHVRGKKLFTISTNICNKSWSSIITEIEKCDVRCTNCHLRRTIKTSDNHDWYKVIMYKENQWQSTTE